MDEEDFLGWRLRDSRHDTELWKFEYEYRPYLKNLLDTDLDKRLQDLRRNLTYLICPLRDEVPLRAHFLSSWWWLKKRFHTLYEFERRGREPSKSTEVATSASSVRAPPCVPRHPNACDFVVKYGEAQWLVPMVERGAVRLAPAHSYSGEITDEARYDDELNKWRYNLGDNITIVMPDGRVSPIIGDLKQTSTFPNYYVICASNEFDYRLMSCFRSREGAPADAAIVIWNLNEFARRVECAVEGRLPLWYFHYSSVAYFDPYDVGRYEDVDPGMSKDYLYAYQREYRFLWLSLHGGIARDAMFIDTGPLTDIAGVFGADGTFIAGRKAP